MSERVRRYAVVTVSGGKRRVVDTFDLLQGAQQLADRMGEALHQRPPDTPGIGKKRKSQPRLWVEVEVIEMRTGQRV